MPIIPFVDPMAAMGMPQQAQQPPMLPMPPPTQNAQAQNPGIWQRIGGQFGGMLQNPAFQQALAQMLITRLGGAYGGYAGLGMAQQRQQMMEDEMRRKEMEQRQAYQQQMLNQQSLQQEDLKAYRDAMIQNQQQAHQDSIARIKQGEEERKQKEYSERLQGARGAMERHITSGLKPENVRALSFRVAEQYGLEAEDARKLAETSEMAVGAKVPKKEDESTYEAKIAAFKKASGREPTPQEIQRMFGVAPPVQDMTSKNMAIAVRMSDNFKNDPIVKNYVLASDNAAMINQLPPTGLTAADNIAAIYAFAKVMDPNSVVREGEYATVQKYAQSWREKFGLDVVRIFANKEFLSPQAIANMKAAVNAKMKPTKTAYKSIYKQYQDRIGKATGDPSLADMIIDYSEAYPEVVSEPQKLSPEAQKIVDKWKNEK